MKLFFSLFLFCASAVFAGTVNLYNDTTWPLTAEVLAADGSLLGKEQVDPRKTVTWSGGWSGGEVSQTPYTVRWLCLEGGQEFSTCYSVSPGSTVSATLCEGGKQCPVKK